MNIKVNTAEILEFYSQQSAKYPSQRMGVRVGHIKDVARHGAAIAEDIGLDDRGKAILKIATYLHDYYQVMQIAGDAPDPHLHHAEPQAIEMVLFGNGMIDKYAEGLSCFDKEVIKTAIVEHAKIAIELPEGADPHLVLFCNLLRDADKSAIYELIQDPIYVLKNDHGYSDEQIVGSTSKDGNIHGVSEKVLSEVMNGNCVFNADVKTPADWAISSLAYLYDVKTQSARKKMLKSASVFVSNLPFSDEVNGIVRSCYYHVLSELMLK